MNPVKHFKGNKSLGTFVSEEKDGKVLFGWSKYNIKKESMEGIPFSKKEGRKFAYESSDLSITINIEKGYIQKGDIKAYDYEMTESAIEFVKRMKKYFRKTPNNVTVILSIKHLNKLIMKMHGRNQELENSNHFLIKENIKLKDRITKYTDILKILKCGIAEVNV